MDRTEFVDVSDKARAAGLTQDVIITRIAWEWFVVQGDFKAVETHDESMRLWQLLCDLDEDAYSHLLVPVFEDAYERERITVYHQADLLDPLEPPKYPGGPRLPRPFC